MKRPTRNALVELLHEALSEPRASVPIELLHTLCKYFCTAPVNGLSLLDILRIAQEDTPHSPERGLQTILKLAAHGSLLRLVFVGTDIAAPPPVPTTQNCAGWLVALAPEAQCHLGAVEERLQMYRGVLDQLSGGHGDLAGGDSLERAFLRAAACFNAGLFFEAHEILEEPWLHLPSGPLRRFLQGLIQISVGFHHACDARFFGATNQLGKGLEKTLGRTEVAVGLDGEKFFVRVHAIREEMLARGARGMERMRLQGIPQMPSVLVSFDR